MISGDSQSWEREIPGKKKILIRSTICTKSAFNQLSGAHHRILLFRIARPRVISNKKQDITSSVI